jgi:hypothetical protein
VTHSGGRGRDSICDRSGGLRVDAAAVLSALSGARSVSGANTTGTCNNTTPDSAWSTRRGRLARRNRHLAATWDGTIAAGTPIARRAERSTGPWARRIPASSPPATMPRQNLCRHRSEQRKCHRRRARGRQQSRAVIIAGYGNAGAGGRGDLGGGHCIRACSTSAAGRSMSTSRRILADARLPPGADVARRDRPPSSRPAVDCSTTSPTSSRTSIHSSPASGTCRPARSASSTAATRCSGESATASFPTVEGQQQRRSSKPSSRQQHDRSTRTRGITIGAGGRTIFFAGAKALDPGAQLHGPGVDELQQQAHRRKPKGLACRSPSCRTS